MRLRVKPSKPLDWGKILAHVPVERRASVRASIVEHYDDVVTTNWPVVEDEPEPSGNRVLRFKRDPMTMWLVERVSLNDMASACANGYGGPWDRRRIEDFYRGMGYSLHGFAEVFRSGATAWHSGRKRAT